MKQETFIENILNSTNGITKVNPDDSLFSKIQGKIDTIEPVDKYTKWLVAACVLILLSLNFNMFMNTSNNRNKENLSELVPTTNNQLYK